MAVRWLSGFLAASPFTLPESGRSSRGHRVPGRPAANPPVTRAGRRPGRSTHQPDAPRAAPVALPPGPVPGPPAGRDRLRVISSIYIRHCGPTPRCR